MPINRQDYEQWLLLYVDNELTAEQRAEVEAFLAANPDLAAELELLMDSKLQTEPLQFPGKSALLKQPAPEADYETQLLLHLDQELSADASKELLTQVAASAELSASWAILQQTKLQPEPIPYPDKAELYRNSSRRVVPMRWWQLAAAALLIGAGLWGTVRWVNGEEGMMNREERTMNEVASSRQPNQQGMTNREERTKNEIAASNLQPNEQGMVNREEGTANEVVSSRQPNEQGITNRQERTKNEMAASNLQPSTFNHQPNEQGRVNREEKTANEVVSSRQPSTVNRQQNEQEITNREERTGNEVAAANLQPSTFNLPQNEQESVNREERTGNEVAVSNQQPSPISQQPASGGSSDVVYASFDEDDDEGRPRKTRLGAFFKRAKRVFERKTKIKTGNSEDVRIANMTFAMH